MVSRTIAFFRDSSDADQKYHWVVLFLVPVVGGLSAYGGVLLIDALRTWGLLGDVFKGVDFGGEHANAPTMAAAFLFGFVERLLDNVVGKASDGVGTVTAAEAGQPAPPGDGTSPPPPPPGGTTGQGETTGQDEGSGPSDTPDPSSAIPQDGSAATATGAPDEDDTEGGDPT